MSDPTTDLTQLSPEKLMHNFTQGQFSRWIALAVVVHVVLIGGLSFGYIRDTWIDPEGAAVRQAAAKAAAEARLPKPPPPAKVEPAAAAATSTNPPAATAKTLLEQRQDTPIVKAITATATTNEIPVQPDDLGISINDTLLK